MGAFSERSPVLYDEVTCRKQADKIIAVCRHFSVRLPEEMTCLDLDASSGLMTGHFARHFRRVIAVDPDLIGLKAARELTAQDNVEFLCTDGNRIGLDDGSVDVVICSRIYEYVGNQEGLLSEIYRVLKYSGLCYFDAASGGVLAEHDCSVPFLSWMPRWLANWYIRLAGNDSGCTIRLLSLRKLRRLTADFWRHDYTRLIFERPEYFHADDPVRSGSIVACLPGRILRLLYPLFPGWIWVLTKKR